MLKQRYENRIVSCLVCWTCHGRMGPNHYTPKDGCAVCGLCESKNPLANLRKLSILEVTTPAEIIVCFYAVGNDRSCPPRRSSRLVAMSSTIASFMKILVFAYISPLSAVGKEAG
jgi:hypothetical protein